MKVTIYSKSWCPYCQQAKRFLNHLDIDYEEIDITSDPETERMIKEKTGLKTVPQIFVDQRFVGGYTELRQWHRRGRLESLKAAV